MCVSSRHMILASAVFKAMLSRDFNEGITLEKQGKLEIHLPDDDPAALLIVLNVIHGHIRNVPRQIDLQTLTKIAVLVDKYEFHESIEWFSDVWIDHLKVDLPTTDIANITAWLCIAWVFKKPLEFYKMAYNALWESQDKFDLYTAQYPIPGRIIG